MGPDCASFRLFVASRELTLEDDYGQDVILGFDLAPGEDPAVIDLNVIQFGTLCFAGDRPYVV